VARQDAAPGDGANDGLTASRNNGGARSWRR
jgi:hypothetical protein